MQQHVSGDRSEIMLRIQIGDEPGRDQSVWRWIVFTRRAL
jgi:hypothetical protein